MILPSLFALLLAAAAPEPRQVGSLHIGYPYPSPDGKQLVTQANFDGRWQLYLVEVESGELKRLSVSPRDDTHPAWSPDGKSVAFISNEAGNDDVYILDIGTGRRRPLSPHPGKDGHPKWSADGRWIVFNRTFDPADKGGDTDSAIVRVRIDGTALETISDTPNIETFASFSPDGRSVAFIEWFTNAAGERARNADIVVVDIASKRRRNITNSDAFTGHPFWGPDNWIYFAEALPAVPRELLLHRVRPDGSDRQQLTAQDGLGEVRPIPDRDRRRLFYNQTRPGLILPFWMPLPPAG